MARDRRRESGEGVDMAVEGGRAAGSSLQESEGGRNARANERRGLEHQDVW